MFKFNLFFSQESDRESSCGSPEPAISMGVDESTDLHLSRKLLQHHRAEEPHQNEQPQPPVSHHQHQQQQQQQHKMTPAAAAHLNGTSKFVQLLFRFILRPGRLYSACVCAFYITRKKRIILYGVSRLEQLILP